MTTIRRMTSLTIRMTVHGRDKEMAGFTDSPYEYMMQQEPEPGRSERVSAPQYPPGHRCHGCPYGRDRPCIGVCMKEIYREKRKNRAEGHQRMAE